MAGKLYVSSPTKQMRNQCFSTQADLSWPLYYRSYSSTVSARDGKSAPTQISIQAEALVMNLSISCLLFTHMNGENLHLPVPPVPIELQPRQRHPQRAQLCTGAWRGGAWEELGRAGADPDVERGTRQNGKEGGRSRESS